MNQLKRLEDVALLCLRLVLAYGFFNPAMHKLNNIENVADWFTSMSYPVPLFSAYVAGVTEILGALLLLLGIGTRVITLPLMFMMLVAIVTVHWGSGFEASDNGFEIPLYYILMLFTILTKGPDKYSLDNLLRDKFPEAVRKYL